MKTLTYLTILCLGIGILVAQANQPSVGETEINGQVVKVQEIAAVDNEGDVIQVTVQTKEKETIEARLCPRWYLDSDIEKGDEVTLVGKYKNGIGFIVRELARSEHQNGIGSTVRELARNRIRYQIRGKNYEPLWLQYRLRAEHHFYNPKSERKYKGKVEELYKDLSSDMMEARIRMENGKEKGELIRVRLAPEWYLQNRLRIGDEIEFRGAVVTSNGEKMIIAREVRVARTRTELSLRNKQGFPMWQQRKQHRGRGSGDGSGPGSGRGQGGKGKGRRGNGGGPGPH